MRNGLSDDLEERLINTDDVDICVHYFVSRNQRAAEIEMDKGLEGTKGYEKMGCYDCDGKDISCKSYLPFSYLLD